MSFSQEKKSGFILDPSKLPSHVAIIMDGNGRWAKSKGLPRVYGHKKGVETASVELVSNKNEYTIQKGDTLWGIAQKYDGLSVWKIKSLNNLDSDNLKPGTKIILSR